MRGNFSGGTHSHATCASTVIYRRGARGMGVVYNAIFYAPVDIAFKNWIIHTANDIYSLLPFLIFGDIINKGDEECNDHFFL